MASLSRYFNSLYPPCGFDIANNKPSICWNNACRIACFSLFVSFIFDPPVFNYIKYTLFSATRQVKNPGIRFFSCLLTVIMLYWNCGFLGASKTLWDAVGYRTVPPPHSRYCVNFTSGIEKEEGSRYGGDQREPMKVSILITFISYWLSIQITLKPSL